MADFNGLIDELPSCFRDPNTWVGSSRNSIVIGYERQGFVAKIDRSSTMRAYPSVSAAYERICRELNERGWLRSEIQSHASSPDIVPWVDVVLHDAQNGEVGYSEIQEWIQGGKTLAGMGFGVLGKPAEVLRDIRLIFQASLRYYRMTGDLFDLQGTEEGLRPLQKFLAAFMPLFSSTNILVDGEDHVRFIDATTLIGINLPLRTQIHRKIKAVGTLISIGIINAALLL